MNTKILLPGGGFEPSFTIEQLFNSAALGVFRVSWLPGAKSKVSDSKPDRVVKWFGGLVGFWTDGHARVLDSKDAASDCWQDCRFHRVDELVEVHFVINSGGVS